MKTMSALFDALPLSPQIYRHFEDNFCGYLFRGAVPRRPLHHSHGDVLHVRGGQVLAVPHLEKVPQVCVYFLPCNLLLI